MKPLNKRGSTLSSWAFIILSVSLFLIIIQQVVLDGTSASPGMNRLYNQNYSIGLGTDASESIEAWRGLSASNKEELEKAEVSRLSDGITLVQIGSVAIGTFRTIINFASGRFLNVLLTEQLGLPEIVATVITIMLWISIIFLIVRLFMRGVTP